MPRKPCRLTLVAVLLCATGFLAACQTGGLGAAGKSPDSVTTNAVVGDPIEVTALDAPPGEAVAPGAAETAKAAGTETAAPQAASAAAAASAPAEVAANPAPQPDLAQTPVTPKSEQQLACEKRKGRWARVGKGEGRACVFQTRDSGKRCERESQCDSLCLARSGTCAPFKPMYGCNEILQDNGARVTLCLE
ncbi:hypothetical protein [Tabrizicola sp.]|uniref:hypothetical protein n=1 Tax=Tabrizicola sp. TaxID=2005166 RepID=UPI002735176C|nr:hypothetical protein [Tabrizicola sp.]MDP3195024.1 hypothetical protein [Tabrizicola sp.]